MHIVIDNPVMSKCSCGSVYKVSNPDEEVIKNVRAVYVDKKANLRKILCRKCKTWIEEKIS